MGVDASIPESAGGPYPCPKDDGGLLHLIEATDDRQAGAWCPVCKTVFREVGEVDLNDLDVLDGNQ